MPHLFQINAAFVTSHDYALLRSASAMTCKEEQYQQLSLVMVSPMLQEIDSGLKLAVQDFRQFMARFQIN